MDPVLESTLSAHESSMLNEKEREREERGEGKKVRRRRRRGRERRITKIGRREGARDGEDEKEEEMKDDLSALPMTLKSIPYSKTYQLTCISRLLF